MSRRQPHFSADDLARVVATTFIETVEYLPVLSSTNDRALQLCRDDARPRTTLVLTDEQTAGRGRGPNRWWSSAGALTFSVLIDAAAMQLPPAVWPRISLAAGLSVCDAVDQLLDGQFADLKWPNDVLCHGRKLCGILSEVSPHRKNMLVLGIGINVNNQFAGAPADLQDSVTSLRDLSERHVSPCDVLVAILQQLAAKLPCLVENPERLSRQWQERCLLTGRTVHLELPDRCLWGVCQGIAQDGALLIETTAGLERCLSGAVRRWA